MRPRTTITAEYSPAPASFAVASRRSLSPLPPIAVMIHRRLDSGMSGVSPSSNLKRSEVMRSRTSKSGVSNASTNIGSIEGPICHSDSSASCRTRKLRLRKFSIPRSTSSRSIVGATSTGSWETEILTSIAQTNNANTTQHTNDREPVLV